MSSYLRLDESTVRFLARPNTPQDLLDALVAAQRRKRLLQLAVVRRRLAEESAVFLEQTGFASAVGVLADAPDAVRNAIADYPWFGRWCAVATSMVDRDLHRRLPEGHVRDHFVRFGVIALCTGLAARRQVSARVPLDRFARASLPSQGLVLCAPPTHAGVHLSCTTHADGTLEVVSPLLTQPQRAACSPEAPNDDPSRRIAMTRLASVHGVELNDLEPMLYEGPKDAPHVERLTPKSRDAWRGIIQSAMRVLGLAGADYLRHAATFARVVVPVLSPDQRAHVSSSSADAMGMVAMSWSESATQIAEALVHEAHHAKLNALFDLLALLDDPGESARFCSPWRDDPRPLHGLLHGAFAFTSVVTLWSDLFLRDDGRGLADEAREQVVRRREQVRVAIATLKEMGKLTRAGTWVVDELEEALGRNPVPSSAELRTRVEWSLADHRARWQAAHSRSQDDANRDARDAAWLCAGGHLRTATLVQELVPLSDDVALRSVCARLGVPAGIALNPGEHGVLRRDPTLDELGRLYVREPDAFANLEEEILQLDGSSPLAALFRAHVLFIRGRHEHAAQEYARVLSAAPSNHDAWRDFSFAVRHAGETYASDGFLFHASHVLHAATRFELARGVLEELGESAVPAWAQANECSIALLLLRWARRAHDAA